MKFTTLLPLLVLLSCTKKQQDVTTTSQQSTQSEAKPVGCNFGIIQFNKAKRPFNPDVALSSKKAPDTETPATSVPNATIYIDFDGQHVAGTYWNTNGDIDAAPANLLPSEIEKVMHRVEEDFAPFNVTVTTSEAVYNQTNPFKRIRVVVTESWQWYGVVGGISYPNSFQWGNNTPCFVFSTLLSYNEKWIAEAISHEVGHTLSLAHQASYSDNCTLLTEFNPGSGTGVTSWAPIMGSAYFQNVTTWHKGRTLGGCNSVQDDVAVLTAILGKREDELDATQKEETVEVANGVLTASDDVDRLYIDIKDDATICAFPSCLDNCEGANLDLQIKVYRKNGQFVTSINNPESLSATTRLPAGKYLIDVESVATPYQNRYGMLGTYHVLVKR